MLIKKGGKKYPPFNPNKKKTTSKIQRVFIASRLFNLL